MCLPCMVPSGTLEVHKDNYYNGKTFFRNWNYTQNSASFPDDFVKGLKYKFRHKNIHGGI